MIDDLAEATWDREPDDLFLRIGHRFGRADLRRRMRDRWALTRRSINRPEQAAYYLAYPPVGTDIDRLVHVAGPRWAIEERVQAAKNEIGRAHV